MPTLNLGSILANSASKHPDRIALAIGDVSITYVQLQRQALTTASALTNLGVDARANVALLLPNVPQFTSSFYGALSRGSTVVPLNVLLKQDEIAYHLEHSEAQVIIVWEAFLGEAEKAFAKVDGCKHLIIVPQDPKDEKEFDAAGGQHNLNTLLKEAAPLKEIAPTKPEDTAVILYTSGTTGKPKGAELTHFCLFQNAMYAGSTLIDNRLSREDVYLCTLPLFHIFALTVVQNAALSIGAKVVLLPRFEPKQALTLMQDHKVSVFAGVPTMYFALLNHPDAALFDLNLKICVSGGAAMPVEVMKAFDEKYNVNILEGYGLSETSPVSSFNRLDRPKKAGSVGTPIDYVELCLVGDDGEVITQTDERGEICIRGANVMKGYYNDPAATETAITIDGWFKSGDIGTRDEDGYYYVVDRKKDMVVRGGYNVYPREIEEVLYQHEAIAEAAVIGIPDERLGEEVKAVVALKPGKSATTEEIISFCKEKLAAYKYPRVCEIVESLPKGPTGKILKRALRPE